MDARKTNRPLPVLATPGECDEPSLGAIKRALVELSGPAGNATPDSAALLRGAHDLLRQIAVRSGIDPDAALQRSRAAAELRRKNLVIVGASMSDQAPR